MHTCNLPKHDNDKVKRVPATFQVRLSSSNQPKGDDFHDTFKNENHHKDNLGNLNCSIPPRIGWYWLIVWIDLPIVYACHGDRVQNNHCQDECVKVRSWCDEAYQPFSEWRFDWYPSQRLWCIFVFCWSNVVLGRMHSHKSHAISTLHSFVESMLFQIQNNFLRHVLSSIKYLRSYHMPLMTTTCN